MIVSSGSGDFSAAELAERNVVHVFSELKLLLETEVNLVLNKDKNLTQKVSVKPFQIHIMYNSDMMFFSHRPT